MTPRIDLDVVIDVFPVWALKPDSGWLILLVLSTAPAPLMSCKRPRLLPDVAWNSDAAEQNDFAAGNRRRVIGRRIGREAHKIGKAVSAAVRSRILLFAGGIGGINDIERIEIIVLWLT